MNCLYCGKEINALKSNRRYCDADCRHAAFRKRRKTCPKCGFKWDEKKGQVEDNT